MAPKTQVGSFRPIKTGESGRYELRVSGGPDPARPGKYLLHRDVVGPLNKKGKPLTPVDVQKELAAFVVRVERGDLPKTGIRFGELLDRYLVTLNTQDRENSTMRTYRGLIRKWIRPRIGDVPVASLTAEHFDKVYTAMKEAGRSAGTVNQAHAVCRKACNLAMGWGYLTVNPTKATSRPTVRRSRKKPDLKLLVNIVVAAGMEDPVLGTFLLVSAGMGGRRGETCGIRWCDILWDESAVHVEVAIGLDDDGSAVDEEGYVRADRYGTIEPEVKDPKDHQDRTVDLPLTIMRALRAHRDYCEEIARFARVKIKSDGLIFSPDPDGSTPPRPDHFTDAFARVRSNLGVSSEVKMKDLRHLYATLLLANGIPIATVADLLGHDNQTTTLSFYNSSLPGAGRVGADVLEGVLGLEGIADRLGLPAAPSDAAESGVA
jgi:integrase